MAKQIVRVRKRRRLKISGLIGMVFTLSMIAFIFTSLFTTNINYTLNRQLEDAKSKVQVLRTQNEAIMADVQELRNYNRVVSIANDAGLNLIHDNTITVEGGE